MATYSDIFESLARQLIDFQECCTRHRDTGTGDTGVAYIVFPNGYLFMYDRYNGRDGPFALFNDLEKVSTSNAEIQKLLQEFEIAGNEKVTIPCVVRTNNLHKLQNACKPGNQAVTVKGTACWLKLTEMSVSLYDMKHAQAEAHYSLINH